jgi:hypothetical protein
MLLNLYQILLILDSYHATGRLKSSRANIVKYIFLVKFGFIIQYNSFQGLGDFSITFLYYDFEIALK